jgi:predicted component of type VI protein secretion system
MSKGELVGVLVGIDGELKGHMYGVTDGDNKLGRSQECDLNLLDPKISREHAMIASEDGVLLILPLSDKNPVFLNDSVVDEGDQLSDGDKLRLGNSGSSTFRFRTIEGQ